MPFKIRDHPRACGEKVGDGGEPFAISGSPPRVRGKVNNLVWQRWMDRDHPRACGEKPAGKGELMYPQGSPPRVRGKG